MQARGEISDAPPRLARLAAALTLLALGGCGTLGHGSNPVADGGAQVAAAPPQPRAEATTNVPDPLIDFYAQVQGNLTASGRMRSDTAPSDAPFTVDDLVRNFERIALYDEYVDVGGRFLRRETPALLRRWDRPVRVSVIVGPSVPPEAASRDRANVAGFTRRLAGLTGLDMTFTDGFDTNFLVLVLSSEEQADFAEQAAERFPGFEPAVLDALRGTPVDTFCTAYAFASPSNPSVYAAVMILIRSEHPEMTRLSCVHEEMAQAMGLPNDSPEARPSLFNDNLEFAFLTEHDEILLRMLYDPRLRPGMSAAEARPLLPAIARDAMAANARAREQVARVAVN